MKQKLKILLASLCLSLPWTAAGAQEAVEFAVDASYPPYTYEEDGITKGIYVDILEAAFDRLGEFDVKFRALPWKRALALVEEGSMVGIVPPYFKPDERPYMRPYSVPILLEQVAVFCDERALAVDRPQWPEDYYGLRIANNRGYLTPGPVFFEAVRDGIIELNEVSDADTGIRMVIQGRVDCYINDAQAIRWSLAKLQKTGEYKPEILKIVQGAVASGEWGYVGYTDRDDGFFPYKETLVFRLDRVIRDMQEKGEIQQIVDQFFTTATD